MEARYDQGMTCREFESALRANFGSVDRDEWQRRITREHWDDLPPSEHTVHLAACSDCQTSLFQFIDVRDFLEFESHPCFHVAYYSADTPDRCLDLHEGDYTIPIGHSTRAVLSSLTALGVASSYRPLHRVAERYADTSTDRVTILSSPEKMRVFKCLKGWLPILTL